MVGCLTSWQWMNYQSKIPEGHSMLYLGWQCGHHKSARLNSLSFLHKIGNPPCAGQPIAWNKQDILTRTIKLELRKSIGQTNLYHTLPLGGSKRIIREPGQWFASKHMTSIPAMLIFWLMGKTCILSHGIPIFRLTSFAVIEEQ